MQHSYSAIVTGCMVSILLYPAAIYADNISMPVETKVINLQNKTASELIPLIEPMLPQGSIVTGNDYQLVVKTTPEGFSNLRSLLTSLDRPPQVLVISTRRIRSAAFDTEMNAPDNVDVVGTKPTSRADDEQRITVEDGQAAFIKTGEAIPINSWNDGPYPTTDYQEITSGFYVTPKLHGKEVTLYINWKNNKLAHQETYWQSTRSPINVEQSESTLNVPLGKWISLSNTSRQSLPQSNAESYDTQDVQTPDKNVFIKVDLLPANYIQEENMKGTSVDSFNPTIRPH